MQINQLTQSIISAAMEVHRVLGPGLLESIYEECLCRELEFRDIAFERQKVMPVEYKGVHMHCGFRIDLVVENAVVVEVKAVQEILPVHEAQLITYLKLGGWNVGLIINFNVHLLKRGIRRLVFALKDENRPRA